MRKVSLILKPTAVEFFLIISLIAANRHFDLGTKRSVLIAVSRSVLIAAIYHLNLVTRTVSFPEIQPKLHVRCVYTPTVRKSTVDMSVVRLLRSSARILRHSSTPCQGAPGHVGPLFSAPMADTYLGFKGRKNPYHTKPIRNTIGHVGVAYDHNKTRSKMMTPGNTIGHVGIPYDHSKSRSTIMVPRASATTTTSFKEADLLSPITIYTVTGEPAQFKDLWDQNNGMAVVALLRHFGCPCSWELASTLKDVKPKFDAAGVKLIALGVGTPDKAHILAERLPFPMDSLFADPDRKAYNALGLYYGLRRTLFNPASVFRAFESYRKTLKKYSPSAMPEDMSSVLQQGGMYVFKGKELFYARKDEHSGDHAPLDDVLNVCCTVPVL